MSAFVAVVEEGGFARAARRLGSSPPAVTRAVAELEQRLSLKLLTRTTRVVRVTEAGARFADDCRRILAEVDEAEEAAAGVHAAPRGLLTITSPVLFGAAYVTPIVTRFLQQHEATRVACWFVDRVVNLIDEGVDVAIRIGELPDSSLQAARVGAVRRVLCAAPSYLGIRGTPSRPEDLAMHTLISASGVTPRSEWQFLDGTEPRSVEVRPRLTTTTNDSALAAARAGFGITRLLSYQIATELAAGTLQPLLTQFEPPPLPVHVVHREGRRASARVRNFVDLAVQRLRADQSLQWA